MNQEAVRKNWWSHILRVWISLPALWLVACTHLAPVADATKNFDASVKAGTRAMGDLYRGMNESEVGLYYLMIELDPECELGNELTLFNPTDGSTSLCRRPANRDAESFVIANPAVHPPFSTAGISRRLQLLDSMSRYSGTLAMAASSDSPAQYQAELAALTKDLRSLENSIRALDQNPARTARDKSFVDTVVSPLSSLAGVVGRWLLEHKQKQAVLRAVNEGRAPFEAIANFLARDLEDIYAPAASTAAADRDATLKFYYSTNRKSMTLAERAAFIERVRAAAAAADAVKASHPEAVPKSLLGAHAALVEAVSASDAARNGQDLAAVQAALEDFLDDLELIVDAVDKLKAL